MWPCCDNGSQKTRLAGSRLCIEAKNNYRRYVQEGIPLGSRPELVGGGLIRSLGSWSNVISIRRHGQRDVSDERI